MNNRYITSFIFLFSLQILSAQVDYRSYQSPVKNQADRGTCTAFAILAAMETFQGFPSDLSEQYVYAWAKMKHYKELDEYSEGAFLKFYIDILQTSGTLREDQEPYNPNAPLWDDGESDFEKMKKDLQGSTIAYLLKFPPFYYKLHPDMYTYLEGVAAQDIDYIKERLDQGLRAIPVTYSLNGAYWFSHPATADNPIDPRPFIYFKDKVAKYDYGVAKLMYGNTLFDKVNEGIITPYYTDTKYSCKEGHAVAIVGYNDEGFLIKNSWGTDNWGDKGYGWISFDYHRMFVNEVLMLSWGKVFVLDGDFKESGGWTKDQFWIKTLPNEYHSDFLKMHTKGIGVSIVYHGEAQMPRFDEIKYDAYDTDGKLLGTFYANCHGIFDGRETGYGTHILSAESIMYPECYKLVAQFKTVKGETFTNSYYHLKAVNEELKPQ